MLAIRDLNKTYANGVRALDAVTLDIPRGMFGLLGPNGAGKSSLMRTLATLQEADSGTATVTVTAPSHAHQYMVPFIAHWPGASSTAWRSDVAAVIQAERLAALARLENLDAAKTPRGSHDHREEFARALVVDAMISRAEAEMRWLDRAVTRGALHRNTAARRKSQAARLVSG